MSHPLYDLKLSEIEISVFDLETTGFHPGKDQVIQIALVPVSNGQLVDDSWMRYVNPGEDHLPIPDWLSEFTGISNSDLNKASGMSDIIKEFDELVGTTIVAGHNIKGFDLKFMKKAEQKYGVDIQLTYFIDTLVLMRKLHPELKSRKLADCGRFYEIEFQDNDLHDALADTRLTAEVMLAQFKELENLGVRTFGEMLDFVS